MNPAISRPPATNDPNFALKCAYREGAKDLLESVLSWLEERLLDEPEDNSVARRGETEDLSHG
jgi:hypothetical protein